MSKWDKRKLALLGIGTLLFITIMNPKVSISAESYGNYIPAIQQIASNSGALTSKNVVGSMEDTSAGIQNKLVGNSIAQNVDVDDPTSVGGVVYGDAQFELNKPSLTRVKEDIFKRTKNSKHYLLEDGSYQAVVTLNDQHYVDENGDLQEILPTLVDELQLESVNMPFSKETAKELKEVIQTTKNKLDTNDSFYRSPFTPFDVKIPKNYKNGYSIRLGDQSLKFTPVNANNVTHAVYDGSINYYEVWQDTDVKLDLIDNGIKETIIVKSPNSPKEFTFEINGLDDALTSMVIQPSWLIDANNKYRDVNQEIRRENNKTYIELTYDPSNLAYPIYIDPTVIISPDANSGKDAPVSNGSNENFGTSTRLVIGNSLYEYSGYSLSYIQFDVSNFSSTQIHSASLDIAISEYDYPMDNHSIYVDKVTSPWDENTITWYNKPTSNPASVSHVDNVYLKSIKDGWARIPITNLMNEWVYGGVANYGMLLNKPNVSYEGKMYFFSSEYSDPNLRPRLVVTYNEMPSVLKVTSPNGGETIDATHTITWNGAMDSDSPQSTLKYQVQLSTDGGANWGDLVSLTPAGTTLYTYNFESITATTTALIRVRAFDGVFYGPWDQSDNYFTIAHNRAPNAPFSLNPGSTNSTTPTLVAGTTPTLNWSFSDPDAGDTQSAYNVLIYNTSNTLIHNSGWISSSMKSYTVPSGILARGSVYYWKVQVKDSKGAASPVSANLYIKPNTLPTLNLTSYTNGQTVPDNVLTFTWTYSDADGQAQTAYQIQGSKDNFTTIAYDSGSRSGNALSFTTPPLSNGTWSFRIRVMDGMEWSNWAVRSGLSLPNTFEANNTTGTATPALYGTYSTYIGSSTDVDFFKYKAGSTGVDRVQLSPATGLNYDVYVYDMSNNLLAAGVRGSTSAENVIFEVTKDSDYYVKVVGVGGAYSTSSTYTLTISNVSFKYQTDYQYDDNGNIKSKTTIRIN